MTVSFVGMYVLGFVIFPHQNDNRSLLRRGQAPNKLNARFVFVHVDPFARCEYNSTSLCREKATSETKGTTFQKKAQIQLENNRHFSLNLNLKFSSDYYPFDGSKPVMFSLFVFGWCVLQHQGRSMAVY